MVTVAKEEGDVLLIGLVVEGAIIIKGTILKVVMEEEVVKDKGQIHGSHLINGTNECKRTWGGQKITT